MDFYCNKDKKLIIDTKAGDQYIRHAIQTDFVNVGDSYLSVVETYAKDLVQEGDILAICEKIVALCQQRVVRREEIKIGFLAKFLSRFAAKNDGGVGVHETIKMQYAIDKVGAFRVLYASIIGAIHKLFGKRGTFYEIVGYEVAGLDGFYGKVWDEYKDLGIEIPDQPNDVCNDIKKNLGITCMIIDANDFGQEILGKSDNLSMSDSELVELIRDNPAGQQKELTPLILIRKVNKSNSQHAALLEETQISSEPVETPDPEHTASQESTEDASRAPTEPADLDSAAESVKQPATLDA